MSFICYRNFTCPGQFLTSPARNVLSLVCSCWWAIVSLVIVQIPMKFDPRILIDNTYVQQVNLSLPFWVLYHEYCFINSLTPGRFWMNILIIDFEADFNDSWLKCLCEFGWNCHQTNIPGHHCQHCFKFMSLDLAWCCQATSHHWLEFEDL